MFFLKFPLLFYFTTVLYFWLNVHDKSFTNKTVWLFVLPLSVLTIKRINGVSYKSAHLLVCIILFMHINIYIFCFYDDFKGA